MQTQYSVISSLLLCVTGTAIAGASGNTPDDILVRKGLSKVGITWLLQDDISLPEGLRAVRAAKAHVDENTSRRQRLERQIKSANDAIGQWTAQYQQASRQMAFAKKDDVRNYNQLVTVTNNLDHNIRQGEQFVQDRQKELAALSDPRDTYITALLDVSAKMEATAETYSELAADPDVTQALFKLNETARVKMKLGPSAQFAQELPRIRKQRESIITGPIKITFDGGTPHVTVTLNGKATEVMTLDSGAAAVAISWQLAQKAGITPGPDDPTITTSLAGGQKAEAKVVMLKTVQVGPFVAHDVECFVFPESAKDVDPLLGDSFLRHFVYKTDLNAGELHMSQLAPAEAPAPPRRASATTRPSGATAHSATPPDDFKGSMFPVSSSGRWGEVDFEVTEGQCYQIKARGKWMGSKGPMVGPEGLCPPELFSVLGPQPQLTTEQHLSVYAGQHPRYALIAKIGSENWTFYVGTECRFIAPVSGRLSFRMNEPNNTAPLQKGQVEVAITSITPQWVAHNGTVEILARIDALDMLHITPKGIFWEWGGAWGKVGLHEGYWPTVVNGIYWWPKWKDDKHTEVLPALELWPQDPKRFQIAAVEARRGTVELGARGSEDVVLKFRDNGLGSSQVGCVIAPGNPVLRVERKSADDGWMLLFRSADPGQWNSAAEDSGSFAVPLEAAPGTMRYLRMRNLAGDYVIIPMTADDLKKNSLHGDAKKWGWEGRDYDANHARHLGIYLPALPRARTGSIDITQVPGAGYTGYGFGNRVNRDDVQGYVWAGKPVERSALEIAVTSRDLTHGEREHLIGE